jgi:PAS domain S-box-containing protein
MMDSSLIVQASDAVVFLIDEQKIFRHYWTNEEEKSWLSPQGFIGKTIMAVFPDGLGSIDIEKKIERVLATGTPIKFIYQPYNHHRKNSWLRAKIMLTKPHDSTDKRLLLLSLTDCTEEVHSYEQHPHLFQSLVDQNCEAIRYIDLDLTIRYVNEATNRMYGYEEGELIGRKVNQITQDPNINIVEVTEIIQQKGSWTGEVWQVRKDQSKFLSFLSIQLLRDHQGQPMGYASQSKDLSAQKETATQLRTIIAERETLLREIHHRVKNNLQVVTSLLSLQSITLPDEHIREVFRQSQYRINAMATIHETLYRSNNFMGIDYRQYLITLSQYLLLSMKGTKHQVTLDLKVPEITLSLDTAIPLGLLVNEIITNALKYGIIGQEQGRITIRLEQKNKQQYELYIGDNGKGYAETINFNNTTSLGLKLIQNLARQLNGTIERDASQQGTYYRLLFLEILDETPMDKAKAPISKL